MSGRHERSLSNVTVTQKVGSRISDRFWEMRQAIGRRADGSMETAPVWVDMRSGEDGGEKQVFMPEGGWNDSPANLSSGDPGRQACWQPPSQRYRENFSKIRWND